MEILRISNWEFTTQNFRWQCDLSLMCLPLLSRIESNFVCLRSKQKVAIIIKLKVGDVILIVVFWKDYFSRCKVFAHVVQFHNIRTFPSCSKLVSLVWETNLIKQRTILDILVFNHSKHFLSPNIPYAQSAVFMSRCHQQPIRMELNWMQLMKRVNLAEYLLLLDVIEAPIVVEWAESTIVV